MARAKVIHPQFAQVLHNTTVFNELRKPQLLKFLAEIACILDAYNTLVSKLSQYCTYTLICVMDLSIYVKLTNRIQCRTIYPRNLLLVHWDRRIIIVFHTLLLLLASSLSQKYRTVYMQLSVGGRAKWVLKN